jgi:hypothetical protein
MGLVVVVFSLIVVAGRYALTIARIDFPGQKSDVVCGVSNFGRITVVTITIRKIT